tara:strand:+ start:1808 stop:2299 length:492 start_codon:yes stop_codon:yes gene_type:complete
MAGERTSRVRVSSHVQLYHKIASDNDMPEHNVGTTDSLFAGGKGGVFDGETDNDAAALTVQEYLTAVASGGTATVGTDTTDLQLIVVKHTGFTDSTKTTTTTDRVEIGFGAAYDGGTGVSIGAGGCFIISYPSNAVDRFADYHFESSGSDTVYVELTGTNGGD